MFVDLYAKGANDSFFSKQMELSCFSISVFLRASLVSLKTLNEMINATADFKILHVASILSSD